jgi:adenylate cyclase
VRRVPLFVITEGNLMPALSLEVLRVASGAGSIGIVTSRTGIRGATVGSLFIPTDGKGRAYPYFTPSYEDRYVSAADILGGSYDLSKLRGAVVFLGVTALGFVDHMQTPLGSMAGVEVHAQLLESMLTGNLLRRPPILTPIEIGVVITIGLLTIFALPYRQPSFAAAVVGLAVLLLVGSEFASFLLFRLLFDGVYPAITTLVVFSVMVGYNLRASTFPANRTRRSEPEKPG